MKKLISLSTALLIATSMNAAADGGNRWEQIAEDKAVQHLHTGTPSASEMGHTAIQHKKWLFDGAKNSELDANIPQHIHSQPKHIDHMGSDHKLETFGSN